VTNPDIGLTAHLTPRGECEGLFVESLTATEIVVRELRGGTSDVMFDYIVHGLRIGFEESSVIQEKKREAYIPSMTSVRARYEQYSELRRYSPLERFKRMRVEAGEITPIDLASAHALRDAIEEFDPAVHKVDSPGMLGKEDVPRAHQDEQPDPTEDVGSLPVESAKQAVRTAASNDEQIEELRARLEVLEATIARLSGTDEGGVR
jgi:hypothetical protein